eukprot:11327330-Alexandrium_andersonii.AAC.1
MGPRSRDMARPGLPCHCREGLSDVVLPLGRVSPDELEPWSRRLGGVWEVSEVGRGRPEKGQ